MFEDVTLVVDGHCLVRRYCPCGLQVSVEQERVEPARWSDGLA